MEKASRVMYTIANIFNWICLIGSVALVVLGILTLTHVGEFTNQPLFNIVYGAVMFIVCLILISMTRIAKDKKSSKGWDVLFIVLGAITWDPFYVLGGIFGVLARK